MPDLATLLVPGRATPIVHNAMIDYCEVDRSGLIFAILATPAGMSADNMVTYVSQTAALEGRSEFGAIFWPRVAVMNPATAVLRIRGDGPHRFRADSSRASSA